jgi:hypothetical protein
VPNKTITQVPVAAKDIQSLILEPRLVDGQLTIYCTVRYQAVSDHGRPLGPHDLVLPLTAPQQDAVMNFVTNTVLPALNAAEGT